MANITRRFQWQDHRRPPSGRRWRAHSSPCRRVDFRSPSSSSWPTVQRAQLQSHACSHSQIHCLPFSLTTSPCFTHISSTCPGMGAPIEPLTPGNALGSFMSCNECVRMPAGGAHLVDGCVFAISDTDSRNRFSRLEKNSKDLLLAFSSHLCKLTLPYRKSQKLRKIKCEFLKFGKSLNRMWNVETDAENADNGREACDAQHGERVVCGV